MNNQLRQLSLPSVSFELPTEGFVRLPDVLKVIPVSRSAWYAGIQTGHFPIGIKIGARTAAWDVEAIRALIQSLKSNPSSIAAPAPKPSPQASATKRVMVFPRRVGTASQITRRTSS